MKKIDINFFKLPEMKKLKLYEFDETYIFAAIYNEEKYFIFGILYCDRFIHISLEDIEMIQNNIDLIEKNLIVYLNDSISINELLKQNFSHYIDYNVFKDFKNKNENMFKMT
jgi:hypothetical protein